MKSVGIHIFIFIIYVCIYIFYPVFGNDWIGTVISAHLIFIFIQYGIYILKSRDTFKQSGRQNLPLSTADKSITVGIYSFIGIFIFLTLFWAITTPSTLIFSNQLNWTTVFADGFISLILGIVITAINMVFRK